MVAAPAVTMAYFVAHDDIGIKAELFELIVCDLEDVTGTDDLLGASKGYSHAELTGGAMVSADMILGHDPD